MACNMIVIIAFYPYLDFKILKYVHMANSKLKYVRINCVLVNNGR